MSSWGRRQRPARLEHRMLPVGVVALATVAAASLVAPPPAAAAAERCDELVVDEARVLGDHAGEVVDAATELARLGARVRVRTEGTTRTGDVDEHQRLLEATCPSWTADGARRADLLTVLVVVADRQTGIYYGTRWAGPLDPVWRQIQEREMNSRFREGAFGEGITAGLVALHQAIDPAADPSPDAPVGPGGGFAREVGPVDRPTPRVFEPEVDTGPPGWFVAMIVVSVGFAALGAAGRRGHGPLPIGRRHRRHGALGSPAWHDHDQHPDGLHDTPAPGSSSWSSGGIGGSRDGGGGSSSWGSSPSSGGGGSPRSGGGSTGW